MSKKVELLERLARLKASLHLAIDSVDVAAIMQEIKATEVYLRESPLMQDEEPLA